MDKYDKAIEFLNSQNNRVLRDCWMLNGKYSVGEPLFQYASKSGHDDKPGIGCITMIRNHLNTKSFNVEGREDLSEQIRNDKKIPRGINFITKESLPIFAKWQRILDVELERKI